MAYTEQYREHIEHSFKAFCKTVLHNEAINACHDFQRKERREVSFDYLICETSFAPFTTDNCFERYDKPTVFVVHGKEVVVASKRLATALSNLSEQRRIVLLMYFFLGYSDKQIGTEYGHSRSTAR